MIRLDYSSTLFGDLLDKTVSNEKSDNKTPAQTSSPAQKTETVTTSQEKEQLKIEAEAQLYQLQLQLINPQSQSPVSKMNTGLWTNEEDKALLNAFEKYGAKWIKVAEDVKTRTNKQCSTRFNTILKRGKSCPKEIKKNLKIISYQSHTSYTTRIMLEMKARLDISKSANEIETPAPSLPEQMEKSSAQETSLLPKTTSH